MWREDWIVTSVSLAKLQTQKINHSCQTLYPFSRGFHRHCFQFYPSAIQVRCPIYRNVTFFSPLLADGFCSFETTPFLNGSLVWQETAVGATATTPCPIARNATRQCGLQGEWLPPNVAECPGTYVRMCVVFTDSIPSLPLLSGPFPLFPPLPHAIPHSPSPPLLYRLM